MIYGTYQLPDGTWQTVAAFQDVDEARETLSFHAAGLPWLMAEDPAALDRLVDDWTHDTRDD
jgi:hypothetical protein